MTTVQLNRMRKLLSINCLHHGNLEHATGKRWMIALDGSSASRRTWEETIKAIEPNDHLVIVTAQDKTLPRRHSLEPEDEVQMRFAIWRTARSILQGYLDELLASSSLVRRSVLSSSQPFTTVANHRSPMHTRRSRANSP